MHGAGAAEVPFTESFSASISMHRISGLRLQNTTHAIELYPAQTSDEYRSVPRHTAAHRQLLRAPSSARSSAPPCRTDCDKNFANPRMQAWMWRVKVLTNGTFAARKSVVNWLGTSATTSHGLCSLSAHAIAVALPPSELWRPQLCALRRGDQRLDKVRRFEMRPRHVVSTGTREAHHLATGNARR
jgi:hypothetical protein